MAKFLKNLQEVLELETVEEEGGDQADVHAVVRVVHKQQDRVLLVGPGIR